MNGSGGWPLTVLLTPDRKPFWAGTYLPKIQLLSLLEQASTLWRKNREGVLQAGELLTEHLQKERESEPDAPSRKLAELAPFTADYPIPASGARYYLCRGGACQSPVDSVEALEKQLNQRVK